MLSSRVILVGKFHWHKLHNKFRAKHRCSMANNLKIMFLWQRGGYLSFTVVASFSSSPSFLSFNGKQLPLPQASCFRIRCGWMKKNMIQNKMSFLVWLLYFVKYFFFFFPSFKTHLHSRSVSAPRWYISQPWFTDHLKEPFIKSKYNRKKKIGI